MSNKRPGISIRQPVRAQAATFAPGNVPTAADYGPWEANIGGFVYLSDGVTTTPFPDGWTRNGSQDQPIVTRTLIYSFSQDMSQSATLNGATIADDCFISFSGDLTDIFEVIFIVNGQRLPPIEAQPYQFPFVLADYPDTLSTVTVVARIEFEDGSKERISSTFTVDQAVSVPIFITTDRATTVNMTGQAGGTAPDLTFTLSNTGTDITPTYTATDNATWITPSIVGDVMTLAFPVSGLAAGEYQGTVTVSATDLVPLVITVNLTVTAAATYQLVQADNSSFTNPAALNGSILTGNRYIGVLPTSGVASVKWNLNGTDVVTRTGTPFDFGAEPAATAAATYDTSILANGTHTITATITPTGGQRNYILQSQTLSTAPWSNFTTTVTTGDTIAGPEGSTLMFIAATTGVSAVQHTHSQSVAKPSSAITQFNVRVYIKPKAGVEQYYWRMIVGDSSSLTGYCSMYFRLDPGNVGVVSSNVPAGSSLGWSIISSSVVESGVAGVYQVDLIGTTDASANLYPRLTWTQTAGGTSTYAAATALGAYVAWQVDFGASAMTAYTATVGSQIIGTGGTPTTLSATISTNNAPKLLEVDKPQIVFLGTAAAASPSAQTLVLKPTVGTAAWTSAEVVDIPWLSTTASGSATPEVPSTVTFTPTTGALVAGQYTGTVRFSAAGYTSVDVPITFNVAAAAPTYDLFYSETGVGVAPVAKLGGQTLQRFYLWLANTSTPSVPYVLPAGDTFKFWNIATTVAQEATNGTARSMVGGQTCIINVPTGLVENTAGPKDYHWLLTSGGTQIRGDAAYNYGSASAHKTDYGLYMRVDRSQGKLATQADGNTFLSTQEITFAQHPACKGLLFQFPWGSIERGASPGGAYTWTQVDACIARAKTFGKKAGFSIAPQKWGRPPSYINNDPNLYDETSVAGNPDWNNATVRAAWKRLWRAVSARYEDNPDVVLFTTDEAWWAPSAAWKALGRTEAGLSIGYYSINLEIMTEIDPATGKRPFRKTHWFIGGNSLFEPQAPGGNFDRLVDAGCGVYQPDGLVNNKTRGGTQGLILKYKGRMGSLLFGDSFSMAAANLTPIFPNAPMASYKMNADFRVSNAIAEYNPGTSYWGGSAAECMQNNYFAVMAVATAVRVNPPNPGWQADIAQLLEYVRVNGFPNTTSPSNLALKT